MIVTPRILLAVMSAFLLNCQYSAYSEESLKQTRTGEEQTWNLAIAFVAKDGVKTPLDGCVAYALVPRDVVPPSRRDPAVHELQITNGGLSPRSVVAQPIDVLRVRNITQSSQPLRVLSAGISHLITAGGSIEMQLERGIYVAETEDHLLKSNLFVVGHSLGAVSNARGRLTICGVPTSCRIFIVKPPPYHRMVAVRGNGIEARTSGRSIRIEILSAVGELKLQGVIEPE